MKKLLRFSDYADHMIRQASEVDTNFKLEQTNYHNYHDMYGITTNSLQIEELRFSFNLKKYHPWILKKLLFLIRRINWNDVYTISSINKGDVLVSIVLKRDESLKRFTSQVEGPDEIENKFILS